MAALGGHVGDSVRERGPAGSARAQLLLAKPGAGGAANNGFVWLGNDLKDYKAHILGATLTYRFK
jgi:hypothetical protein